MVATLSQKYMLLILSDYICTYVAKIIMFHSYVALQLITTQQEKIGRMYIQNLITFLDFEF